MIRILLIFFILVIPVSGFSQRKESSAFIRAESEYPEYVLYTMKVFPKRQDTIFKIELAQIDSTGKEVILSSALINISTVLYKKAHQMESGKVKESLYTAIKKNDKWEDEYIAVRDCSESTYLEGSIKLKKNGIYILRVFNQDKLFFEEKTELQQ